MNDVSGESRRALVEQLRHRQEESWKAGQQLTVEEILEGVDARLLTEDDILELLYGEICLRELHESAAAADEFVQRFPQLEERIVRLFEMHEVLEREENRGNSTWGESQDRTELFDPEASSKTTSQLANAVDSESTLPDVSGYELLEELGRGGMGRVFEARQEGTEQVVALKMVRGDWLDRLDDDLRRQAINQFGLEVRATAQLKHPNIVDVQHYGGGRRAAVLRNGVGGRR